jgi:hypothetical protein
MAFEPLRSHHGAHAGAARDLVQFVGDAGEAHEVLTGRTDLRDPDARVAELGENCVLDLTGDLAPEMRGVAELDRAVADPEIDRRGETPWKTIASQPARFSSAPQYPPDSDSPKPPVRGTWRRAVASGAGHGRAREDSGAITRMLSGPSGSAPFGTYFKR